LARTRLLFGFGLNYRVDNRVDQVKFVNTMGEINQVFSHRLRQARAMAKLSLRELSNAIGNRVSYNALSKYEKGEMMPSGEVLAALAAALHQPADFFFRSFRVELADINFRKRLKLSATEPSAIVEKAKDFFERYCEVEQLLGCIIPFERPFTENEMVVSEADAETAARRLREEKWNLGGDPLPNVHELLELKGIKVHEAETMDEAFDGFSGMANGSPVVVIAGWLDKNLPRKRMTEVHELAHVVLNIPDNVPAKEMERIVSRFAGALLLPEESFRKMFGEGRRTISLGELIQIKAFFGASIMAIMKRAEQLNLISRPVYERFSMVANQQRWRSEGEPGDDKYCGDESHSRFRQLVFRAVAEGVISSSKGAAYLKIGLDEFRGQFQQLFA
jgi:Zn-dependent peptidase ImmA (M78 family)/transcriptional regulator with XRE-family HTH domain